MGQRKPAHCGSYGINTKFYVIPLSFIFIIHISFTTVALLKLGDILPPV
jgi:hypothetical protein